MPDRDPSQAEPAGAVQIEIAGKTAMLLVHLARELGAETPGQVVAQALGVMQVVREAKARGHRILVRDPASGHETDLAL